MTDLRDSPLGHATTYASTYDRSLLFPVERAPQRAALGLAGPLPFDGVDLWTAYELFWLDPQGRPRVAIASLAVPATSPAIVESKSLKLYLVSFNGTQFAGADAVAATIARDLSAAAGAAVEVTLTEPAGFPGLPRGELPGTWLDDLPFDGAGLDVHAPDPAPERLAAAGPVVAETLATRLFRSVCPVTGQPDYASVAISYRGPRIDATGLFAYLVSFRRHPGFHEQCVERIFVDVARRCGPAALAVYARFTRRGGIDINPFRARGYPLPARNQRTARQ